MGAFGGLILTNKGRALQAKVQAGTTLHYTRIALGDGNLNGQSISDLSGMISEKKSLDITKLKQLGDGKVTVGAYLTNQGLATGFYFRELGVFATDPDLGEILYCYGNAGLNAEYIPAGGGPDIVEKNIDLVTTVGNGANVTATIDQSLVYMTQQDFDDHKNAAILDHPDGSVTDAKFANLTADPNTAVAYGLTGKPLQFISWILKFFKAITGKPGPFDIPAITLESVNTQLTAATSSPTVSVLMKRDTNGRAQVADPSAAQDIVNLQTMQALDNKDAARAATTANITLSGTQTVDGVVLAVGDRVLVKNQTTGSQNGIYNVASGSWTRATDADTAAKISCGTEVRVMEGTVNALTAWQLTTTGAITLGTTSLTFTQVEGTPDASTLEYGNGKLRAKDGGITDAKIGNRTVNDSTAQTSGAAATITTLLGQIGNMIKAITGKANWYTAPAITLESLNAHVNATTGIHGATSAATANTIAQRDANARLQVADPVAVQDAANKGFVEALLNGIANKAYVRAATTANITLSGTQTIDNVALIAGDRVLVKDQTTGSQNGIYVVAAGAWARATDADIAPAEVKPGLYTFVSEGTVNGDNGFTLTTNDPIILGTTSLTFIQSTGAGQITAGNALTKTGNQLDVAVDNTGIEINADTLRLKDGGVTDAKIGNRTINDAIAIGTTDTDTPSNLFSKIGAVIRAITGKADWYTAPVTTIEALNTAMGTKLNATDYTANDVLAKLLTVDGSASGIDSETVSGWKFRDTNGYPEYSTDDGGTWKPVGIIANKPRSANLEQATSSTGVWYTVLDITSGKGRLSRAAAGIPNTSSTNELVEIRITVDGSAQVHKPSTANHMRGLYHSGNRYGQYVIDLFFNAEFLSSLKVEVRQTTVASPDLQAIVDYALV